MQALADMTANELYQAVCKYLYDNGWMREEYGSGWFWKQGHEECLIGTALDFQLLQDNIELRDEPSGLQSPGYWG